MKTKALVMIALVAGWMGAACGAPLAERLAAKVTEPKTYEKDGQKLLYRFHAPKTVEAGKKYPLVVLLHGAGERGNDNISQLVHGADELLGYAARTHEEIYFIAGQVPHNCRWVEHDWAAKRHTMDAQPAANLSLLLSLIDQSVAELPIDTSRIYVTGISMGGYGTWEAIQRRPELFAAAMPICGGGDTACASKLKDLPIWCFHGDADGAVPTSRSRDMFAAIRSVGGIVRYKEYPGVGHDCWTRTYRNDEILAWFFSQKKAK